jgi:predicted XRE-type DNA-binding protein
VTLKEWLEANQMTQEQFASVSGIGQSSVSRVCVGGHCLPATAVKIYEATEGAVTPNDIYLHQAA